MATLWLNLEQRLPNLVLYDPITIADRYQFIVHRLLSELSHMAGSEPVEVQCVLICPKTGIPTVFVDVPISIWHDLDPLFDETQRLLTIASQNQRL